MLPSSEAEAKDETWESEIKDEKWPVELYYFTTAEDRKILQIRFMDHTPEDRKNRQKVIGKMKNLKSKLRIAVDICRANGIVNCSAAECLAKGFLPKATEIKSMKTELHPKLRPYFTKEEINVLLSRKDRKKDHSTKIAFKSASTKFGKVVGALRKVEDLFAFGGGKFQPSAEFVTMMEKTCGVSTVRQEEIKRKRDAPIVTSEDREAAELLNRFAEEHDLVKFLNNLAKRRAQ